MKKITLSITVLFMVLAGNSQTLFTSGIYEQDSLVNSAPCSVCAHWAFSRDSSKLFRYNTVSLKWEEFLSGGGAIENPTVETFDSALVFTSSKYYQSYSTTDSLIFTADTLNGIYGNYTVSRVNFGSPGQPVVFSGAVFDTVQTYNIASGDTLSGVHMFYFEHTPYGVLTSVPTNNIGTIDTVGSIVPLDRSPADSLGNLLAEWDARHNVVINDTITTWTDLSNADRPANNGLANYQPVYNLAENGLVFDGTDDIMSVDSLLRPSLTVNGTNDFTWTIALSFDGPSADEYVIGMDNSGFVLVRGGNNNITHLGTGPFWNPTAGNHIIQMVVTNGNNEIFVDGTSIGSYALSQNTYKLGQMGDFTPIHISNSGKAFDGTLYFVSINEYAMTGPEQTIMYNYLNTKFSLGL